MGQEINTQTSFFLLDIIITGLSYLLAGEEERWWGLGAGHLSTPRPLSFPPLIPLLAGQCLCSDKDFLWGSSRGQSRGGVMKPVRVGLSTVLKVSGNTLLTLRHRYQHTLKAQFELNLSEADG